MSRLSIELTEQQHQQIKAVAALQGQTIREYALARLLPMTADEEHAMGELKALLLPRIEEGLAGKVLDKSITAVAEEALRDDDPA
ncbi:MAG: antitoxin [Nevskia sp.]|nr:antitoxin [Nevskia sp.]